MRHEFSKKTMRLARARSGGFCEATGVVYGLEPGQRCNAPLDGKRVEFDHYPLPAGDEASDTLDNCVACCKKCHARKTAKYDIPVLAKNKRMADRHLGIRTPSRLQSRGFQKSPPQHSATRPIRKEPTA